MSDKLHAALDSQAIARYLEERGYELSRITAHREQYFAVFGVTASTSSKYLITLRAAGDSFQLVGQPQEVGDVFPDSVRLVALAGRGVDGLVVTFDNRLEGVIGTVVYEISDRSLRLIFRDGPDACAPAGLKDLDGDSTLELVSYTDDPSSGDCGDPCHLDLWHRFKIVPGWIRIQRWTGDQWVNVEAKHASYYRDLADQYERVARWVGAGPDGERCRTARWLREGQVLMDWAVKARAVAAGR
jgi:hypothetical protein